MKRLFASILCSAMLAGAFAQADIQVKVVPTVVTPGTDMVEVAIEMVNPDQEVSAGNMNIYLPEGMTVMSEGTDYYVVMNEERMTYNKLKKTWSHDILGAYQTDGSFKIIFSSSTNQNLKGTEGTLFTLYCEVSSAAAAGLLPADLKDIVLVWGESSADRFDQEESRGYIRVKGNETVGMTIPEGGFGTLCLPFAAELKDGMKAYKATGVANGEVVMVEQESIAANTPLLIEAAPDSYTFSGDNSTATESSYTSGILTGFLFPTEVSEGHVLQQQAAGLGFYRIASERTVPAYRCVLNNPATANMPMYLPVRFYGEETGIHELQSLESNPEIYSIDGKRVTSLSKGKVYIVNGIKTIIK